MAASRAADSIVIAFAEVPVVAGFLSVPSRMPRNYRLENSSRIGRPDRIVKHVELFKRSTFRVLEHILLRFRRHDEECGEVSLMREA